jgi:hypothetical protein
MMFTLIAAAAAACPPLPGINTVLGRPELQFILFGEYHGTVEKPGVVADALCHAKAARKRVVLGIELPVASQTALDAYARDGNEARLLRDQAWREEGGRTTRAILDLLRAARRLRVRTVAFDALPNGNISPEREQAMADNLAAAARSGALVIALTGVGHADKEGFTSRTPPVLTAAGRLPSERTLSLTFARPGGAFWGCNPADDRPNEGCKAYPMPVREAVRPRGIVLDGSYRGGFDGYYSAGAHYSASAPALKK